jgi:hypothetical protein
MLVVEAIMDQVQARAAQEMVEFIYCSIISILLIRFIGVARFFIDKKFS